MSPDVGYTNGCSRRSQTNLVAGREDARMMNLRDHVPEGDPTSRTGSATRSFTSILSPFPTGASRSVASRLQDCVVRGSGLVVSAATISLDPKEAHHCTSC